MQPEQFPSRHHDNGDAAADRATGVLLTDGGVDGVSAFVLRHWRTDTNPPEPVFVTWLLNAGRLLPDGEIRPVLPEGRRVVHR